MRACKYINNIAFPMNGGREREREVTYRVWKRSFEVSVSPDLSLNVNAFLTEVPASTARHYNHQAVSQ